MAIEDKKISYRTYFVAVMFFIMAVFVLIKLNNIQWVEGKYYRQLAKERTVRISQFLQIKEMYILLMEVC